jgi:5,5'-dehydrodivanillate O-demethylase oxygenase subunit
MLSTEENELLTRVGPGTPAGEWMRRYWLPVGVSADLGERPQYVRVLGEDLVLFRTPGGEIGLLDAVCAHRGASLVYGCVEKAGLRCRYHGWLYDASGRCVEQPAEVSRAAREEKVRQRAYPTQELGGLVFAYMGPQPPPALPRFDTLVRTDGTRKATVARTIACNYLQILENSMDPVHLPFVHGESIKVWAGIPEFTVEETEFGMRQVQYRPGPTPAQRYVRSVFHILPFSRMVGIPASEDDFSTPTTIRTIWAVPIDDTHTIEFEVRYQAGVDGRKLDYKFESSPADFEIPLEVPFQQYRGAARVAYPKFFGAQDQLMQLSQGPVAKREREHLRSSDRGVVMVRKLLRQGIEDVKSGRDPRGIIRARPEQVIKLDLADHLVPVEEAAHG